MIFRLPVRQLEKTKHYFLRLVAVTLSSETHRVLWISSRAHPRDRKLLSHPGDGLYIWAGWPTEQWPTSNPADFLSSLWLLSLEITQVQSSDFASHKVWLVLLPLLGGLSLWVFTMPNAPQVMADVSWFWAVWQLWDNLWSPWCHSFQSCACGGVCSSKEFA